MVEQDIANDLRSMADNRCVREWSDLLDAANEIQRLRAAAKYDTLRLKATVLGHSVWLAALTVLIAVRCG